MVQQHNYVARLAAVQQVSSGKSHKHLDGPAKEYSSSACSSPARLEPNDGAYVHALSILRRSVVFPSRHIFLVRHAWLFSSDVVHPLSVLCLRVAILGSDLRDCERKGESEVGGVEIGTASQVSPPRRAMPLS